MYHMSCILENYRHARSQGGRQPAAANLPWYHTRYRYVEQTKMQNVGNKWMHGWTMDKILRIGIISKHACKHGSVPPWINIISYVCTYIGRKPEK